jgi:glycosyltransferase involved in cell wall biosynthesis
LIRSTLCPLVSVVIPCLNRADLLVPTLESVFAQDYACLECVVVDGGSTDGTLEVLKSYEGKLRWVSEPDSGPAEAINKGWKMCHGEILAWLNADDLWAPGAVRTAVEYLEQNPDVDVVYGDCGIIDRDGRRIATAYPRDWDLQYAAEYCDHVIFQAASFMRRSILEKVGWLWPRLCHDHELWLRVSLMGGTIRHVPAVLACARHHPANLGYRSEIVIPLKRAITKQLFEHNMLPEGLKRLRKRALSNACLRGIDYVFLSDATCAESTLRSLSLVREAIKTDPTNIVGSGRFLLRIADMIMARTLRRYLPRQAYERLRTMKRYLFAARSFGGIGDEARE